MSSVVITGVGVGVGVGVGQAGAYIRRDAEAAINQAARIRPETFARIGLLAKYLLAI